MRTPALPEFEAWSKEHANLALTVCKTMAYSQLKREQVDAYILPIFQKYTFRVNPEWTKRAGETVDTPAHLYLIDEDEKCIAYYADCDTTHRAHGFTGPDGHCPALVAEHLLTQAENLLLDVGCEFMGIERDCLAGEQRQKFLDLLLGACLKAATPQQQAEAQAWAASYSRVQS